MQEKIEELEQQLNQRINALMNSDPTAQNIAGQLAAYREIQGNQNGQPEPEVEEVEVG
jgi:hypothetical protein